MYEHGYHYGYGMGTEDKGPLKKLLQKVRGKEEVEKEPFTFGRNQEEDPPFTMEFEGHVTKRGTSLGINLKKEHLKLAQILRGFKTQITLYRPPGEPFWRAQVVFIPPGEDETDSRPEP